MTKARYRLTSALISGLLCSNLLSSCTPEKPVDPLEGYRTAVVDIEPLVKLHPNFNQLEKINREVNELRQEKLKIQNESRDKLISQGGSQMEEAVKKAKTKLEAERAAVEGEISALSSSLSAQIEQEMHGLQASYSAELDREIKRLAPPPPPQAPKLDANIEAQIQDYLQNLSLVRERNLAAKRLELEKRVGDEIAAKKAETDGQIAAYEADLSAQYQGERVNLQLAAQNATDEESKTIAQTRLSEIAQEIEAAKVAKRGELEGSYAAVRAEKTAAVAAQLQAFQGELDAEVQQKLAAKRKEIGLSTAPPRPPTSSGPPPEIKAKIRQVEAQMKAELRAKQAALQGQMEAKMAQSRTRLEAKQKEVEASLTKIEEEIQKQIAAGLANLPEDVKAELSSIDEKIENLGEETKKLYKSIRSDIDTQVAGIAKDKEETMVIGVYQYKDPSFQDLTDLSQVRIQQMETK